MKPEGPRREVVFQRLQDDTGALFWLLRESTNYFWTEDTEIDDDRMGELFDRLQTDGVDVTLIYEEMEVVGDEGGYQADDYDRPPPPRRPGRFGGGAPQGGDNPFRRR